MKSYCAVWCVFFCFLCVCVWGGLFVCLFFLQGQVCTLTSTQRLFGYGTKIAYLISLCKVKVTQFFRWSKPGQDLEDFHRGMKETLKTNKQTKQPNNQPNKNTSKESANLYSKDGCGGFTLMGSRHYNCSLTQLPQRNRSIKYDGKGSKAEVKTGRSLNDYCHGQNRLNIWKLI